MENLHLIEHAAEERNGIGNSFASHGLGDAEEGVFEIILSPTIDAFPGVGIHKLPDMVQADGHGVAMRQAIERGDLVAERVGSSGLGDADGLAGEVGSAHDLGGSSLVVVEDISPPVGHNEFDGFLGDGLALVGGVDRPPRLYSLAKGVEHGAFLLVEGQGLQHRGLKDGHIGDDAVVGDALLLALVVDDGITGRLAARTRRGGNGHESDAGVLIGLVEEQPVGGHLAVELDALGHVDSAATTHGDDGVALVGVEQLNAFADLLVEGIGGEVVEDNGIAKDGIDLRLDAQEWVGGIADKHDFLASGDGLTEMLYAVIDGLHDWLLWFIDWLTSGGRSMLRPYSEHLPFSRPPTS